MNITPELYLKHLPSDALQRELLTRAIARTTRALAEANKAWELHRIKAHDQSLLATNLEAKRLAQERELARQSARRNTLNSPMCNPPPTNSFEMQDLGQL